MEEVEQIFSPCFLSKKANPQILLLRPLHITLALVLLASTSGFTISSHHCGGRLVAVSVFGKAKDCYGNTAATPCKENGAMPFCKKGCCKDETCFFKSETDLDIVVFGFINVELPVAFGKITPFPTKTFFEIAPINLSHLLRPPIVITDILVRLQTFLL